MGLDFCNVYFLTGNAAHDRTIVESVIELVQNHGYEWRRQVAGKGYVSWYFAPGMKEPLKGISLQDAVGLAVKAKKCSLRLCKEWWGFLEVGFGHDSEKSTSDFGIVDISTFSAFFSKDQEGDGDEEALRFVGLCRDLCVDLNPIYASGDVEETEGERVKPPSDQEIVSGSVSGVYWFNYFGPELASSIGRRLLMTAKWERVETLPNGGILALSYLNPREALFENGLDRIKGIETYLGIK